MAATPYASGIDISHQRKAALIQIFYGKQQRPSPPHTTWLRHWLIMQSMRMHFVCNSVFLRHFYFTSLTPTNAEVHRVITQCFTPNGHSQGKKHCVRIKESAKGAYRKKCTHLN